jgi:hypothetical protein
MHPTQNQAPARACGFDSHSGHQICFKEFCSEAQGLFGYKWSGNGGQSLLTRISNIARNQSNSANNVLFSWCIWVFLLALS